MPFFDYKCKCGNAVDHKLVRKHDEVVPCEKCNEPMEKQVAATKYWLLCGPGFYNQHDAPDPSW